MHWEIKIFVSLAVLYQYLLYSGGLKLNLQYLRGTPECGFSFP